MGRKLDEDKKDILLDDNEWDSLLEDDEQFDAAVKEEYIREAEEIEKSLFPEGIPQETPESREAARASYEKFVGQLKKKGIYREDEAEKINREHGRRTMHRQFKAVRAAGIAVACMVGVFLVTMTSEANREYFVKTVKYLTGNDARVTVNNDSENEKTLHDEYKIRKEIEEEIGAKVPEITYRPETFEFYDYYIQQDSKNASIEYMYNDNIIVLFINNGDMDSLSRNISSYGNRQSTFSTEDGNEEVIITETVDEGEKIPNYTAQWKKENVLYQLSGRMEKTVLEEILKTMKYY